MTFEVVDAFALAAILLILSCVIPARPRPRHRAEDPR